ncbi:SH3 domain-containing protein [Patescibacteria group bacterium]|nr:SH3 domain-containing protein [Patescibacteria group bacterium]MBU2036233.1 SH3 domain-containing protein [Patescibacteria group bacterium]
MGKLRKLLLLFFIALLAIFLILFLVGYFKPKGAGIFIDTISVSDVYINESLVGSTPYEAIRNPGEVTVKLVPKDEMLVSFETKVNLVSNVRTVIKREFAESEEESSGEIASFEKVGGKDASVSIVSIPDATQISIDGQVRGFSPYKINSIIPGEHVLVISASGFLERSLTIKAYQGYKLTVVVKLAAGGEVLPTSTPSSNDQETLNIIKIEILETPNNFLRVRSEPSTEAQEVARVVSGNLYSLIEEDSKTGWYKIEYEKGKQGWVSNEYSKKVEE